MFSVLVANPLQSVTAWRVSATDISLVTSLVVLFQASHAAIFSFCLFRRLLGLIIYYNTYIFITLIILIIYYNLSLSFVLVGVHVCLNMYLTLSCCDTRISPLGINEGLSYLILS